MQLAVGLIFSDRCLLFEDHIAGIQSLTHVHGGDTGHALSVDDAPLDRTCAAVFWQQRTMDVDAAIARQFQNLLWQNLAVGNHRNQVRLQFLKDLQRSTVAHLLRLENRNIVRKCQFLDRRCHQLIASALWFVRLGKHADNLMVGFQQLLQRSLCKFGSSHKNNLHL